MTHEQVIATVIAEHLKGLEARVAVLVAKAMEARAILLPEIRCTFDGERTLSVAITQADGRVTTASCALPIPIYRGVWAEGQYERHDMVTHRGSIWIAEKATAEKPRSDEGAGSWRLGVKSGDRGLDAETIKQICETAIASELQKLQEVEK